MHNKGIFNGWVKCKAKVLSSLLRLVTVDRYVFKTSHCTILTFDRDYGELIFYHNYNYRPQRGVIYLRLDEYAADEPGKVIEDLIDKKEFGFDYALTVLDKNGIGQRKH